MFRKDESNRLQESLSGADLLLSSSLLTSENALQRRLSNVKRLKFVTCCRFSQLLRPPRHQSDDIAKSGDKIKSNESSTELQNEISEFCRFNKDGTLNFYDIQTPGKDESRGVNDAIIGVSFHRLTVD